MPNELEKKAEDRKKIILQQQQEGIPILRWCPKNQISSRQFYYWKKKLFHNPPENACFTEILDSKQTGITPKYQRVIIHIDPSFDSFVLKKCIKALKEIEY